MKIFNSIIYSAIALSGIAFASCMKESETDKNAKEYAEWKQRNDTYVAQQEALTENGAPVFTRISPVWSPDAWFLARWHNDRSLNSDGPTPLDNSTVVIKYALYDIEGTLIQDSYAATDSAYTCTPSANIVGVWAALTQMHVGDSVSLVLPYNSAYGARAYGSIRPFSTLLYTLKLKSITKYEI